MSNNQSLTSTAANTSAPLQLPQAAEFGIESSRAEQIKAQFEPMLNKMSELEEQYNAIQRQAKQGITAELSESAKELRLQYVKVRTGTARYGGVWGEGKGIIDSQTQVGGWPELKSTTPPADSDHDGMTDDWEEEHGLDSGDPADGGKDGDKDGYTNVEEFINNTDPAHYVDYTKPENNVSSLYNQFDR